MLQYIKNIIPRIQTYSQQLSKVEVFVDKPWILIDEDKNTHEYVFLRDHRLILSVNGKVTEGKWELLPTGKLLINRVTDQVLLQHAYIDDAILILKISGDEDLPFMLINEKVILDKDPVKYLQKVEAQKLNYDLYSTEDGIIINNLSSSTGKFEVGATLTFDTGVLINGELTSTSGDMKHCYVLNGVIQEFYFLLEYKTIYGFNVFTKQQNDYGIYPGDRIVNYTLLPNFDLKKPFGDDGSYYRIVIDNDGVVTKVVSKEDYNMRIIGYSLLLIFIILMIVVIFGLDMGHSNTETEPARADSAFYRTDTTHLQMDTTSAEPDTSKPKYY